MLIFRALITIVVSLNDKTAVELSNIYLINLVSGFFYMIYVMRMLFD